MLPPHAASSSNCGIPSKVPKVARLDILDLVDEDSDNETSQDLNQTLASKDGMPSSTSQSDDNTNEPMLSSGEQQFVNGKTTEDHDCGVFSYDQISHVESHGDMAGQLPLYGDTSGSLRAVASQDDQESILDIEASQQEADSLTGLEPFLMQFDAYFRRKLDEELHQFREGLHDMLTEQQIHVRNIVGLGNENTTNSQMQTVPQTDDQNNTSEDGELQSSAMTSQDESSPLEAMAISQGYITEDNEERASAGLVIELLSLSCQLTTLLNGPKYRDNRNGTL